MLKWLKQVERDNDHEFARTFNTGLGMILVVDSSLADETERQLSESDETVFQIGHLAQRRNDGCVIRNMERWNV